MEDDVPRRQGLKRSLSDPYYDPHHHAGDFMMATHVLAFSLTATRLEWRLLAALPYTYRYCGA